MGFKCLGCAMFVLMTVTMVYLFHWYMNNNLDTFRVSSPVEITTITVTDEPFINSVAEELIMTPRIISKRSASTSKLKNVSKTTTESATTETPNYSQESVENKTAHITPFNEEGKAKDQIFESNKFISASNNTYENLKQIPVVKENKRIQQTDGIVRIKINNNGLVSSKRSLKQDINSDGENEINAADDLLIRQDKNEIIDKSSALSSAHVLNTTESPDVYKSTGNITADIQNSLDNCTLSWNQIQEIAYFLNLYETLKKKLNSENVDDYLPDYKVKLKKEELLLLDSLEKNITDVLSKGEIVDYLDDGEFFPSTETSLTNSVEGTTNADSSNGPTISIINKEYSNQKEQEFSENIELNPSNKTSGRKNSTVVKNNTVYNSPNVGGKRIIFDQSMPTASDNGPKINSSNSLDQAFIMGNIVISNPENISSNEITNGSYAIVNATINPHMKPLPNIVKVTPIENITNAVQIVNSTSNGPRLITLNDFVTTTSNEIFNNLDKTSNTSEVRINTTNNSNVDRLDANVKPTPYENVNYFNTLNITSKNSRDNLDDFVQISPSEITYNPHEIPDKFVNTMSHDGNKNNQSETLQFKSNENIDSPVITENSTFLNMNTSDLNEKPETTFDETIKTLQKNSSNSLNNEIIKYIMNEDSKTTSNESLKNLDNITITYETGTNKPSKITKFSLYNPQLAKNPSVKNLDYSIKDSSNEIANYLDQVDKNANIKRSHIKPDSEDFVKTENISYITTTISTTSDDTNMNNTDMISNQNSNVRIVKEPKFILNSSFHQKDSTTRKSNKYNSLNLKLEDKRATVNDLKIKNKQPVTIILDDFMKASSNGIINNSEQINSNTKKKTGENKPHFKYTIHSPSNENVSFFRTTFNITPGDSTLHNTGIVSNLRLNNTKNIYTNSILNSSSNDEFVTTENSNVHNPIHFNTEDYQKIVDGSKITLKDKGNKRTTNNLDDFDILPSNEIANINKTENTLKTPSNENIKYLSTTMSSELDDTNVKNSGIVSKRRSNDRSTVDPNFILNSSSNHKEVIHRKSNKHNSLNLKVEDYHDTVDDSKITLKNNGDITSDDTNVNNSGIFKNFKTNDRTIKTPYFTLNSSSNHGPGTRKSYKPKIKSENHHDNEKTTNSISNKSSIDIPDNFVKVSSIENDDQIDSSINRKTSMKNPDSRDIVEATSNENINYLTTTIDTTDEDTSLKDSGKVSNVGSNDSNFILNSSINYKDVKARKSNKYNSFNIKSKDYQETLGKSKIALGDKVNKSKNASINILDDFDKASSTEISNNPDQVKKNINRKTLENSHNSLDSLRNPSNEKISYLSDDITTELEDNTTESDDNTTESDDNTTESDDNTTESDDNTTESDDNTTESDDNTTESGDNTTVSDDNTTQSDNNISDTVDASKRTLENKGNITLDDTNVVNTSNIVANLKSNDQINKDTKLILNHKDVTSRKSNKYNSFEIKSEDYKDIINESRRTLENKDNKKITNSFSNNPSINNLDDFVKISSSENADQNDKIINRKIRIKNADSKDDVKAASNDNINYTVTIKTTSEDTNLNNSTIVSKLRSNDKTSKFILNSENGHKDEIATKSTKYNLLNIKSEDNQDTVDDSKIALENKGNKKNTKGFSNNKKREKMEINDNKVEESDIEKGRIQEIQDWTSQPYMLVTEDAIIGANENIKDKIQNMIIKDDQFVENTLQKTYVIESNNTKPKVSEASDTEDYKTNNSVTEMLYIDNINSPSKDYDETDIEATMSQSEDMESENKRNTEDTEEKEIKNRNTWSQMDNEEYTENNSKDSTETEEEERETGKSNKQICGDINKENEFTKSNIEINLLSKTSDPMSKHGDTVANLKSENRETDMNILENEPIKSRLNLLLNRIVYHPQGIKNKVKVSKEFSTESSDYDNPIEDSIPNIRCETLSPKYTESEEYESMLQTLHDVHLNSDIDEGMKGKSIKFKRENSKYIPCKNKKNPKKILKQASTEEPDEEPIEDEEITQEDTTNYIYPKKNVRKNNLLSLKNKLKREKLESVQDEEEEETSEELEDIAKLIVPIVKKKIKPKSIVPPSLKVKPPLKVLKPVRPDLKTLLNKKYKKLPQATAYDENVSESRFSEEDLNEDGLPDIIYVPFKNSNNLDVKSLLLLSNALSKGDSNYFQQPSDVGYQGGVNSHYYSPKNPGHTYYLEPTNSASITDNNYNSISPQYSREQYEQDFPDRYPRDFPDTRRYWEGKRKRKVYLEDEEDPVPQPRKSFFNIEEPTREIANIVKSFQELRKKFKRSQ